MRMKSYAGQWKKQIPNVITSLRIVGTVCLLFLAPLSPAFFVVYTLAGLSDVLDGWIARSMKLVSELGTKLDSIADLMFYTVMFLKIMPVLWATLPKGIWFAVGAIVIVRLCSYSLAAVKYKRFASLHTYMNKVSGGAVFLIPYSMGTAAAVPYCGIVAVITGLASLEELLLHLTAKVYSPERKTIAKELFRKKGTEETPHG